MSMGNQNWTFKNTLEDRPFLEPRKPLLSGWVGGWADGWVGGWVGGDQKGPSIFLIFKYINKQDVLIPHIISILDYGFCIKRYEHFE